MVPTRGAVVKAEFVTVLVIVCFSGLRVQKVNQHLLRYCYSTKYKLR